MTDMIVVGLLLIIIFLILAAASPEILIYGAFGICILGLVIIIVIGLVMFAQDPWGFVYSLIVHNPLTEFENSIINAAPILHGNVSP